MFHTLTTDVSNATIPAQIVPCEWLERGFYCMPHVYKADGTVTRLKGFAAQNTIESYITELVRTMQELGYNANICDRRVQVLCKGLVGIDIDIKDNRGGLANYKELCDKYGIQPSNLIVQTKSLGYHHYYKLSTNQDDTRSPAPFKDADRTWEGIDIRSGNSILIAPMSMTVKHRISTPSSSSAEYRVIKCDIETTNDLPCISDELYTAIGSLKDAGMAIDKELMLSGFSGLRHHGHSIIELIHACAAEIKEVDAGSRNNTLYKFICELMGLGYMEHECTTLGLTFAERCTPPMDENEAVCTITSAWKSHSMKRKETLLRSIRERYIVMAKGNGIAIIDLRRASSQNVFAEAAFKKLQGNSLKMSSTELYTEEERSRLGIKSGRMIDMFQYMLDNQSIRTAEHVGYRPGSAEYCPIALHDDLATNSVVRYMVNNYRAPLLKVDPRWTFLESQEFIADWLKIAHHICGNDADNTNLFLDWLAFCVRNPAKRPLFGCLFINYPGSGKSLTLSLLRYLFGADNFEKTKVHELIKSSGFNGIIANKRLLWIDELPDNLTAAEHSRLESEINSLVTEPMINVSRKGAETVTIENHALLVMTSNHDTCYKIRPDERRLMVFRNMDKSTKIDLSIYERVASIVGNDSDQSPEQHSRRLLFVSHLFNYLSHRSLENFYHDKDAPMTGAKSMLTQISTTSNVDRLKVDIDNNRGVFVSDVVSLEAVIAHYAIYHPFVPLIKLGELKTMCTDTVQLEQSKLFSTICDPRGLPRTIPYYPLAYGAIGLDERLIRLDSNLLTKPPKLFSVRNHSLWRHASDTEVLMEYIKIDRVGARAATSYILDDEMAKIKKDLMNSVSSNSNSN